MRKLEKETMPKNHINKRKISIKIKKCKVLFKDIASNTPILPKFSKESINVCFSSDDNYALYLGVAIQSIKANKSETDKYDICILDGGISEENKKKIQKLADNNFSIRFINISGYLEGVDKDIFSLNLHFTVSTYYRFFIPKIFANYDKVLYLDCDLIINSNIAELYNTNLENFAIGAIRDIEIYRCVFIDDKYNGNIYNYLSQKLKMQNIDKYFQAGVLLFDIQKLKDISFTEKCLAKLKEIKDPMYVDQCVLNSLIDGNYKELDMKWNVLWQVSYYVKDLDKHLPLSLYNKYYQTREDPYIIHYASGIKPWKNPDIELADIWWKYARQTPFYEEILYNNMKQQTSAISKEILNYNKNKLRYYRYKLLSKITFGKMRKHYKKKRKELKAKLKEIKHFLRNNK